MNGTANYRLLASIGGVLLALFLITDSYYVVTQTQQAILFQFRDVVRISDKPGLHFKIPLIQSVDYYEKRVLAVDAPSQEIMRPSRNRWRSTLRAVPLSSIRFCLSALARRADRQRPFGEPFERHDAQRSGTVKMATLLSGERVGVMGKIRDLRQ
jgi:membrane protease subunit HflC